MCNLFRRYFKYFKFRQWLHISTGVMIVISSLFAGNALWQAYKTSQQTMQLDIQLAQMETVYRETKALQPVDIDVLALKDTLD